MLLEQQRDQLVSTQMPMKWCETYRALGGDFTHTKSNYLRTNCTYPKN